MPVEGKKTRQLLKGFSSQACCDLYGAEGYNALFEKVTRYLCPEDRDKLDRALWVAFKAHEGQIRKSGAPYIGHPLEVSFIIAEFCLDVQTLCTAILHDTVEDTSLTQEDIRACFGDAVADMVMGVTKLDHLQCQSRHTKQAENFRKLILAVLKDIRVLVVKLADRLHNMRTLHFIDKKEKRERIAKETIDIYAPLAERIGMGRIKDELEEASFSVLHPQEDRGIRHKLHDLHGKNSTFIEKIRRELLKTCFEAGVSNVSVTGREKTPYSIWLKMQRRHMTFEQLSDVMAFRVIVPTTADCYKVLGFIHSMWRMIPGRFKDYISTPKENGYQSLHTGVVVKRHPYQKIEVQIRTRTMHDVAENGVAAHWAYKTGRDLKAHHDAYVPSARWLHSILDIMHASSAPEDFIENTKLQLYPDQVFCFSPKGEVYSLPKGATPVDFAYSVHSQVGDKCVGAKVDGRMVPLRYKLTNGQQVHIITEAAGHPSLSWERFVVTGKARAHIRKYVHHEERIGLEERGRTVFARILRDHHIEASEFVDYAQYLADALCYVSLKSFYYDIGRRRLNRDKIEKKLLKSAKTPASIEENYLQHFPSKKTLSTSEKNEGEIEAPFSGIDKDVALHYASCCHPLPGDPVMGYIVTGKYISVHHHACKQLNAKRKNAAEIFPLYWNPALNRGNLNASGCEWDGCMRLLMKDNGHALSEIVNVLSREHARMLNLAIFHKEDGVASVLLDVTVANCAHIQRLMKQLRHLAGVHSVERAHIS